MAKPATEDDSLLIDRAITSSSMTTMNGVALVPQASVSCRRGLLQRFFLVEPVALLYFLAYKGSLPLIEQFVYAICAAEHLTLQIANRMDSSIITESCLNGYEINGTYSNELTVAVDNLEATIQSESSLYLMYLNLARDIPALFSTVLICSYTDQGGRKVGLLLPSLGGVMKCVIYVTVMYMRGPTWYFIFGRIVEGICGSQMTAQGAIYSYLADVVPRESRSFRFTVIQASLYFGTGVGNIAVGYLIDSLGFLDSFWCIAALYGAAALYTVIFLPESNQSTASGPSFSFQKTLKMAITVFKVFLVETPTEKLHPEQKPSRKVDTYLILLLVAFGTDCMITIGRNDVDVLYMLGSPFCWTSIDIGYYQGIKYLLKALMDTLGVRLLHVYITDAVLGMFGSLCGVCANILFAAAVTGKMLWAALIPATGSAVVTPIAKAAMSKRISPDDQGSLFSCLGLAECLADLLSGLLFNLIYSSSVSWFSGFIYVIILLLYLLCTTCFAICKFMDQSRLW